MVFISCTWIRVEMRETAVGKICSPHPWTTIKQQKEISFMQFAVPLLGISPPDWLTFSANICTNRTGGADF